MSELGQVAEADEHYREVYAAEPENPWARYRVGAADADRGDTDAAVRTLMTLARNP